MKRTAASVALALAAWAAPAAAQNAEAAKLEAELTATNPVDVGTPFTLSDPQGRPRTLASFKGKIVVLYFGFTFCPDVCPADLKNIARALKLLGKRANNVQALFVTLDPERDTAELMGQYTRAFDPRILGLRGSEAEVNRIARAFKIYSRRVPQAEGGYTIEHSDYTLILDRQGNFRDYIPPGTPSGRTAVMIEEALANTRK